MSARKEEVVKIKIAPKLKILQFANSGYVNVSVILEKVNAKRLSKYKPLKTFKAYLKLKSTQTMLLHLSLEEEISIKDLIKVKRGRYGSTWVHPFILIDFLPWCGYSIDKTALKWGEAFVVLKGEHQSRFLWGLLCSSKFASILSPVVYAMILNRIDEAAGIRKREHLSAYKLKKQEEFQHRMVDFMFKVEDLNECIVLAMRKAKEIRWRDEQMRRKRGKMWV